MSFVFLFFVTRFSVVFSVFQVQSKNVEDHLEFLLQRRRVFHQIFAGTKNLQILVNCILDSLDQSECLPLHIFEQISHPSNGWTSSCLEPAKSPVFFRNLPKSAPPSGFSCFDFSSHEQQMAEHCLTIPLGLVAPPLPYSTGYHNYLTGGGVHGLVDHRLLLLIGAWFPSFYSDQCSGVASSRQIDSSSCLKIVRRRDSPKELFIDEDKKVLLLVSRGCYNACFHLLSSTEQLTRELVLVQKW